MGKKQSNPPSPGIRYRPNPPPAPPKLKQKQPCTKHRDIDCPICLKECIEEILYFTYAPGNGGYASIFGFQLFEEMVKITGYDISKRRILNLEKE